MTTTICQDEIVKITAEHDDMPTKNILDAHKIIIAMHEVVSLDKITFGASTSDPNHYEYKINASDGRRWSQELHFGSSGTFMNFDVADFWALSEFEKQRPIREFLVDGVVNHGMTDFTAKMTT